VAAFVVAYIAALVIVRLVPVSPGWLPVVLWPVFGLTMYGLTVRAVRRGAAIHASASAFAALVVTTVVSVGWRVWAWFELRGHLPGGVYVSPWAWVIVTVVEPIILCAVFAVTAYVAGPGGVSSQGGCGHQLTYHVADSSFVTAQFEDGDGVDCTVSVEVDPWRLRCHERVVR
jgi:hypothetical protein